MTNQYGEPWTFCWEPMPGHEEKGQYQYGRVRDCNGRLIAETESTPMWMDPAHPEEVKKNQLLLEARYWEQRGLRRAVECVNAMAGKDRNKTPKSARQQRCLACGKLPNAPESHPQNNAKEPK